jgi:hypothetical protein
MAKLKDSMEFVKLEPYNRIQTTKLTGDQVCQVVLPDADIRPLR